MRITNENNDVINSAYFEGYCFLSNLEDYWYKITIVNNQIVVEDMDDGTSVGGTIDKIKTFLEETIGKDHLYTVPYDYYCERAQILN